MRQNHPVRPSIQTSAATAESAIETADQGAIDGSTRTYNSPRLIKRRNHILQSVRDALTEVGYHGINMNDIATRAGVTKKTLYNLFGNKEALLSAAIREVIELYRGGNSQDDKGIPTLIASRQQAIRQVELAPAYANAMTSALLQAEPEHELVQLLVADSIHFAAEQISLDINAGNISEDFPAQTIAQQVVNQAWGVNFMLEKQQITIADYARESMSGLLLILQSIARGPRQQTIQHAINDISSRA